MVKSVLSRDRVARSC